MKSQEFREIMMQKLRAFDAWAWKDEISNPDAYDSYEFQEWMELFEAYLQND